MNLKKLMPKLLVPFLLVFLIASPAMAQDETPNWPTYTVQSGDTLYLIASRFGLTVNDLIEANQIGNADFLSVGDVLVLPGIHWVSGELKNYSVPLGENLRSLSRRVRQSTMILARLNGLVIDSQLAAGLQILLPVENEGQWQNARRVLGQGDTLLELAVRENQNPWEILLANQLPGRSQITQGDVLFIPNTNDPGPGTLPSPIQALGIEGESLVQGKTVVFHVQAAEELSGIGGQLLGRPLNFYEDSLGAYTALQGIHVMTNPGLYPLTIQGKTATGSEFVLSQRVLVSSGQYSFEQISVDSSYLDSALSDSENAFVNAITAVFTPEPFWSGQFQAPSPYVGSYNSVFGTRRSFNGSDYVYYHGGLDYEGGTGVQIFAPAVGKVVFTGLLDIRGNATIIDHGLGVYSGYWHQSQINVQVGDTVSPGQVIGLVGNTGRSSGAHLHWEIQVGGVQVDPIDWLRNTYP